MPTLPRSNPEPRPDLVVAYPRRLGASAHDTASHRTLAARLAALLGCPCSADYDPAPGSASLAGRRIYYVPAMTLGSPAAARLGIRQESDLYGGVVPHDFVASKAITHPLLDGARAPAPAGWSARMGARLQDAVLAGYTVFSAEDALRAGALLLRHGAVRVKPVQATAGRGQARVCDEAELRDALRAQDKDEMAQFGLVLEEHLDDVTTYSVGTVRLPGMTASYVGTQQLTRDNDGNAVYGGSDILFVRGGFDALAAQHWPAALQAAIDLARRYDAAVQECYPDFFASRRNYDVAEGRGRAGDCRRGVLEQSWRAGGASMAEVCALEAFSRDAGRSRVRARTNESYGDDDARLPEATIVYDDDDPQVGRISKSAGVVQHGDA
ncbi:DUF3182 family protein [Bordetella petrii]|uniref:DUF3182 family protein n=1 Tax=Bordetella petrii TaxID=94624 RepID=UPI001A9720A8|nr:DUF3182 family protein [Bordetella petrii]MBO1113783.1 DUF3182 family protein [Bordetella petrii]